MASIEGKKLVLSAAILTAFVIGGSGGGKNSVFGASKKENKKSFASEVSKNRRIAAAADDNAPVEFDFIDFSGKPRKVSEFRGKFVLLDFWATWCKPCLADIPKLKELYEKHKADGLEIIGMDSETLGDDDGEPADPDFARQTMQQAQKIIAERGVSWTVATAATAVPIARKVFDVKALPTKVSLDKDGRIVARIGAKDDLASIVEKFLKDGK